MDIQNLLEYRLVVKYILCTVSVLSIARYQSMCVSLARFLVQEQQVNVKANHWRRMSYQRDNRFHESEARSMKANNGKEAAGTPEENTAFLCLKYLPELSKVELSRVELKIETKKLSSG